MVGSLLENSIDSIFGLRPEILSDGEELLMRFLNMPKASSGEELMTITEIKGCRKGWWKKGGVDSLKSR